MLKSSGQLPREIFWSLLFPIIFLNGWLLWLLFNFLEPFTSILITAALFAFLLDFPIGWLQKIGFKRGWAVALVFLLALLILATLGLIIIPLLVQQLSELLSNLPQWIESGSQQLQNLEQWASEQQLSLELNQELAFNLGKVFTQAAQKLSEALKSLSSQIFNIIFGTISSIFNILLILVLTLFLVLTGESVWIGIFSWFPTPWGLKLSQTIQQTFTQYFVSQAILAVILSIAQTIVFLLLNVPYAVLFGCGIGMTTLIPYASAFTIILVSLLLALQNLGLGVKILLVAIIVGQINDNVVAPRLTGGMTGLNPVWLIVVLLIGGKLAGILGLLIAVPLASVIKKSADQMRGIMSEAELALSNSEESRLGTPPNSTAGE
ncbi:MAG: AI-2E family transporter [Xenococcaceae cyanobacterium MO_167.B52]|nr:AI-2E family transporter [Xenococcaceae cyanobacterium MO_167.B52]